MKRSHLPFHASSSARITLFQSAGGGGVALSHLCPSRSEASREGESHRPAMIKLIRIEPSCPFVCTLGPQPDKLIITKYYMLAYLFWSSVIPMSLVIQHPWPMKCQGRLRWIIVRYVQLPLRPKLVQPLTRMELFELCHFMSNNVIWTCHHMREARLPLWSSARAPDICCSILLGGAVLDAGNSSSSPPYSLTTFQQLPTV